MALSSVSVVGNSLRIRRQKIVWWGGRSVLWLLQQQQSRQLKFWSCRTPLVRTKFRTSARTEATAQVISTSCDANGRTPRRRFGENSCDGGWKHLFQSCCSRYWCNCLRRLRHFAWPLTPQPVPPIWGRSVRIWCPPRMRRELRITRMITEIAPCFVRPVMAPLPSIRLLSFLQVCSACTSEYHGWKPQTHCRRFGSDRTPKPVRPRC
jgi:hypothetical protein